MKTTTSPVIFLFSYPQNLDRQQQKLHIWQQSSCLLKKYLGVSENTHLEIGHTIKGKPFLKDFPSCHFNISDSSFFWAIAIGKYPLGLDLECIRPRPSYPSLLERWFGPLEKDPSLAMPSTKTCHTSTLKTKDDTDQLVRFLRMWTCKESLLKQVGCGLGKEMSLHQLRWDSLGKAYAMECSGKLEFHSLLIKNEHKMDFEPSYARMGDLILTLCAPTPEGYQISESTHILTQHFPQEV